MMSMDHNVLSHVVYKGKHDTDRTWFSISYPSVRGTKNTVVGDKTSSTKTVEYIFHCGKIIESTVQQSLQQAAQSVMSASL